VPSITGSSRRRAAVIAVIPSVASVFPHRYVDLASPWARSAPGVTPCREFRELAPFGKLLFSTDGYLVGTAQFRHSFGRLLSRWVAEGALSTEDGRESRRGRR
jgi:hypothetical protein